MVRNSLLSVSLIFLCHQTAFAGDGSAIAKAPKNPPPAEESKDVDKNRKVELPLEILLKKILKNN